MRIALNLLYLIPGLAGGTHTYAVSLIRALAQIDRSNEYYIFLNTESMALGLDLPANFHKVFCPVRGRARLLRYGWEQIILPIQLKARGIHVVHSLGYVGPLASPCPAVVTIPDLNFIALRENMPFARRIALRFFSTQSGLRSGRVITISEFSKADLARRLQLEPAKISVIHLGSREAGAGNRNTSWRQLKCEYGIRQPYIAAFGGARHKNTSRLIEAFASLSDTFPHQLVIIGHLSAGAELEKAKNEGRLAGRLITTGFVPEQDVMPLLGHADLFVMPSLYEGFGLPVLEAQQAGVPVVCSSAASLPEVGGEGALYFDPASTEDMAAALRRSLGDADLRARMARAGTKNLRRFSWAATARQTLGVYTDLHRRSANEPRSAARLSRSLLH
jgi:glycosyltransferase involved in cell wall biosynthesis